MRILRYFLLSLNTSSLYGDEKLRCMRWKLLALHDHGRWWRSGYWSCLDKMTAVNTGLFEVGIDMNGKYGALYASVGSELQ